MDQSEGDGSVVGFGQGHWGLVPLDVARGGLQRPAGNSSVNESG
jgi:hypothetical protein